MEENRPSWGWGERQEHGRQKQGQQEHQVLCMRIYTAGGMGAKQLHIDWRGMCLPKLRSVRESVSPNLILLQTLLVHLVVKQMCDQRQLIKVEAVTRSSLWALSASTRDSLLNQIVTRGRQLTSHFMGFFFRHCGPLPLPPSSPWDEDRVSRFSLSQLVEMMHTESRGFPTCCTSQFWLCCSEYLAALADRAQDC